jgi:UDPglucose--hexose-1-phosphate uridylyltransferase
MADFDLKEHPHRRFNPLTREWILVSPHRSKRPWLGQVEKVTGGAPPTFDPACYMCPGNTRADGAINPRYGSTFVFDNDFPALLADTPHGGLNINDVVVAESESGICRVVCFSPRHDLTLAGMSRPEIRYVIDVWAEQYQDLGAFPFINYVQIFENRGATMGASNPHPHGQIWASASLPNEPAKEQAALQEYEAGKHSCLLCDYLAIERQNGDRMVLENAYFSLVVPFWAIWPFETIIVSRRHLGALTDLSGEERDALADVIKRLTKRYDNLFHVSFPYSMGFHQRPTTNKEHPEWHFHAHFYPPLLRSATVRKFMVGYEMLGTPQRDITAETAAARLRDITEKL